MNFIEIAPDTPLMLHIYKDNKQLNITTHIVRHLDETAAIISLDYEGDHVLNFNGVIIDLEYGLEQAAPFMWKNVRVVYLKGNYILKVFSTDGIKTNRRDSFRVFIGVYARTNRDGMTSVMVKDISHSGFALVSRKPVEGISRGEAIVATFDDYTFHIRLEGVLVRIEERDGQYIYGFKSVVFCPQLPQYLAFKQRPAGSRLLWS
ncbi:MAG: PilZ domain-containing protein [Lachnospiraceae bacterium]|nr:PilZ domain-containing protein [Lachnospiraceae bacterium]